MSPDAASHILCNNVNEAVEDAKNKTALDGRTRYVCKILYKIALTTPPIKVTKVG